MLRYLGRRKHFFKFPRLKQNIYKQCPSPDVKIHAQIFVPVQLAVPRSEKFFEMFEEQIISRDNPPCIQESFLNLFIINCIS